MLQNEPENQQSGIPAAEIRVSAEELTAAINALEEQTAKRLEGTVPIGQVVQELHLNVTSEEIWEQVHKQRLAAAQAEIAAQAVVTAPQPTVAPVLVPPKRHRWRRGWWALFGAGWAIYAIAQGSIGHHEHHPRMPATSSADIVVNGDFQTQTYNVAGKTVEINTDFSTITLHGKPRSVVVNGDADTIITDTSMNVQTNGDDDTVKSQDGPAPTVSHKSQN